MKLCEKLGFGGLVDGKLVPLFNARRQLWSRHFRWEGHVLIGKTLCGKATVKVLKINQSWRIDLRQNLIDEGRFPPDN